MAQPFIGQVILFGGNFAPYGWATCNGQLLGISENEALYQLLGTTYGGNGVNNFAVPDLRSRVPICMGQKSGLSNYVIGQMAGTENVTLTTSTIAAHSHALNINTTAGSATVPATNTLLATEGGADAASAFTYSPFNASQAALSGSSISVATGNSQPHGNIEPYIAMNYIIALYGIFPPQS